MIGKNFLVSKITGILISYKQTEYNRTIKKGEMFPFPSISNNGTICDRRFLGLGFGFGDEDLVLPVFFAGVQIREDRKQEFGVLHRTANRFADHLKNI